MKRDPKMIPLKKPKPSAYAPEPISGDVLTEARLKRRDVEITEGSRGGIEFKTAQVPIDHYLKRRIITLTEYRAADRLYRDFCLSGQTPGMIANLDPLRSGRNEFSEMQMEARQRWRAALNDVQGKLGQLMLLNVCCYGLWLYEINYLPLRIGINSRMTRFREALDDLIDFYDAN